jgi:hypothetical protein
MSESSANSNVIGKLLIDKMLLDMSQILKAEIQKSKQLDLNGIHVLTLKHAIVCFLFL